MTTADKPITVMLVDDHALVRRGFRRLLEDDPALATSRPYVLLGGLARRRFQPSGRHPRGKQHWLAVLGFRAVEAVTTG